MSVIQSLRGLIALLACTLSLAVAAEQVYVSDTLRVGVRPEPDNRTTPIEVVLSGARLEVLERRTGYLKVRTEQGVTGWIRDSYVVSEPPAVLRLQALQAEQAHLQQRLAEAEEAARVLELANRKLTQRVDTLAAERSRLVREQARMQLVTETRPFSATWMWWLLGVLVVAAAGFFSGVSWYRQSVMRRLGGLRV